MTNERMDELDPMQEAWDYSEKYGIPVESDWLIEAQSLGQITAKNKALELDLLEIDKGRLTRHVERFTQLYPKFLDSLLKAGGIMLTFAHTVLIAFVLPAVLVWAVGVEQDRVFNGAVLIDTHTDLAAAVAWVLVVSNLLIELIIHWVEHQSGEDTKKGYAFSLKLVWQQIAYWLGFNKTWEAKEDNPAVWARRLRQLITWTILTLAVGGNMSEVLKLVGHVAWYAAIGEIWNQATSQQMINLAGGVLISVTMVRLVQGDSQYLAKRVIEIIGEMKAMIPDDRNALIAKATGVTAGSYLLSRLKEAYKGQRTLRSSMTSAADMPAVHNGLSGVVSIKTAKTSRSNQDSRVKPRQRKTGQGGQIKQAIAFYKADADLLNWTLRHLEDDYPSTDAPSGISRSSWATAKTRYLAEQDKTE